MRADYPRRDYVISRPSPGPSTHSGLERGPRFGVSPMIKAETGWMGAVLII